MPVESVPRTGLTLHLVLYDSESKERTDDPDGLISCRIIESLKTSPVTDVFLMSHGWLGDIPAARRQYQSWIRTMSANRSDLRQMHEVRAGFRPLLVGLHWPSLPFGDEEIGRSEVSFTGSVSSSDSAVVDGCEHIDRLVDSISHRLANSPSSRTAIRAIIDAAQRDVAPRVLPDDVIEAYRVLDRESELGNGGVGAAPGADREPFDPEAIYHASEEAMVSFGGFGTGGLLAPLQALSFWKMKARAADVGAAAIHPLLREIQRATSNDVRIHLIGHSFGCIVMSGALAGIEHSERLYRPVNSVSLLQGALSLWSYASEIPPARNATGYFRKIIADGCIAGPIITTQSEHDTAVGILYPLAAGVARHLEFSPGTPPKYGAVGTYGIRGPGLDIVDLSLLDTDTSYDFTCRVVYNLESSKVIRSGQLPSGAHSDLAHPEVSHAVWQAAMAGLS